MSQQELTSYRLTSLQEPTDDMLHAIMEQVAESARRSTAKFQAEGLLSDALIERHLHFVTAEEI